MNNEGIEFELGEVKLSCRFVDASTQYTNTKSLKIGKIAVASYCYDGMVSKDNPKKYRIFSDVIKIKSEYEYHETPEECQPICIMIANLFVKKLTQND